MAPDPDKPVITVISFSSASSLITGPPNAVELLVTDETSTTTTTNAAPEAVELLMDNRGGFDADVDEEEGYVQETSRGRAIVRGRGGSSLSSSLGRRRGRTTTTTPLPIHNFCRVSGGQ